MQAQSHMCRCKMDDRTQTHTVARAHWCTSSYMASSQELGDLCMARIKSKNMSSSSFLSSTSRLFIGLFLLTGLLSSLLTSHLLWSIYEASLSICLWGQSCLLLPQVSLCLILYHSASMGNIWSLPSFPSSPSPRFTSTLMPSGNHPLIIAR